MSLPTFLVSVLEKYLLLLIGCRGTDACFSVSSGTRLISCNCTVQRMVIAVRVGGQGEHHRPTHSKMQGAEGGKAGQWVVVYPLRFFTKVYKRRQWGEVSRLIMHMLRAGRVRTSSNSHAAYSSQHAECPMPLTSTEVLGHDAHRRSDH